MERNVNINKDILKEFNLIIYEKIRNKHVK